MVARKLWIVSLSLLSVGITATALTVSFRDSSISSYSLPKKADETLHYMFFTPGKGWDHPYTAFAGTMANDGVMHNGDYVGNIDPIYQIREIEIAVTGVDAASYLTLWLGYEQGIFYNAGTMDNASIRYPSNPYARFFKISASADVKIESIVIIYMCNSPEPYDASYYTLDDSGRISGVNNMGQTLAVFDSGKDVQGFNVSSSNYVFGNMKTLSLTGSFAYGSNIFRPHRLDYLNLDGYVGAIPSSAFSNSAMKVVVGSNVTSIGTLCFDAATHLFLKSADTSIHKDNDHAKAIAYYYVANPGTDEAWKTDGNNHWTYNLIGEPVVIDPSNY